MPVRVILFRAVNVGGAKLPMAQLRSLAEELGATRVSTYIASGNLLCEPPGEPGDSAEFDRALEKAVEARFGFFREVVSRTHTELAEALAAYPFEVVEPRFSYVTFLSATPAPAAVEQASTLPTGDDRWAVIGPHLHLRYADGAGREQMRTTAVLKALGVVGTARNLRTVQTLVDLSAH